MRFASAAVCLKFTRIVGQISIFAGRFQFRTAAGVCNRRQGAHFPAGGFVPRQRINLKPPPKPAKAPPAPRHPAGFAPKFEKKPARPFLFDIFENNSKPARP